MGFARRMVWRTALMVAVVMFAILGSASAGMARVSPSPDIPDQRKYYVVQPSDGIYQIAVDTLGDGNRYREIFALNSGREQSDGRRMTDPMTLQPGWVLVLPADAHGPGVATTPPASPATTPIPTASRRQRTVPVPVLVAVAVFIAIASLALWTFASPVRRAAVTGTVRGVRDRFWQRVGRRDRASRRIRVVHGRLRGLGGRGLGGRGLGGRGLGGTARQIVSHLHRGRVVPVGPSESGTPRGAGPAAAGPEEAASLGEHVPPLTAMLMTECGPIGVELAARARGGRPSYRWLGVFDPAPESSLPVVLGFDEGSRLFVDLADCPDPFTITGSVQDCRRYAAGLARQLLAHGRLVQVVGDVLGVDQPDGCERLTTMPALTGPSSGDRTHLVITAGLRGHNLADLRQCLRHDDRKVAVIIIGDVLRSRWSVSLPTRGVTAEGAPGPAATEGATP
jgi:hypothetical protein